jgi:hypothetical protein
MVTAEPPSGINIPNQCTVQFSVGSGRGQSVMLSLDVGHYPPSARGMYGAVNAAGVTERQSISGLGDAAERFHVTVANADQLHAVKGPWLITFTFSRRSGPPICAPDQAQRLGAVVLGPCPRSSSPGAERRCRRVMRHTELSARTFCTFPRQFSSFRRLRSY